MDDPRLPNDAHATSLAVRLIREGDSFEALTALLHRAYAPLAAMGFRYKATYQDAATTRDRAAKGECYLGLLGERVVGTVLLIPPDRRAAHCEWYDRSDVAIVSQFAIEPEYQGRGLGNRLLAFAEERAAVLGAAEVSVDTSENAAHLIAYYEAHGYRLVGHAQWSHTNFRSVLLSKSLSGGETHGT